MDRDCGWAHLLPENGDDVLGRGRVILTQATSEGSDESAAGGLPDPGQLDPSAEVWEGRIDPLRVEGDGGLPRPGTYRIRFEANDQILAVEVLGSEELGEEGQGQAFIRSLDGVLPSVYVELGGD